MGTWTFGPGPPRHRDFGLRVWDSGLRVSDFGP